MSESPKELHEIILDEARGQWRLECGHSRVLVGVDNDSERVKMNEPKSHTCKERSKFPPRGQLPPRDNIL